MTKATKPGKKNSLAGKNILKTVTAQLMSELTILKELLGEKEFSKRVKKAAKKLVAGVKHKTAVATKKAALKKSKKATPVKKKKAKPVVKK